MAKHRAPKMPPQMAPDRGMPSAPPGMKKGGGVKKMAGGGAVTRGDGIVSKGHTKGRMV